MSENKSAVCKGSYELGTACGTCERCIENIKTIKNVFYGEYSRKLEQQLEKAEEVIRFYADEDNWFNDGAVSEDGFIENSDMTPNFKKSKTSNYMFDCGGSRARNYFKENGE